MVNYRYKAIDASGRQVSGEMAAQSTKQVEQKLQSQRLVPVYVVSGKPAEAPKEQSSNPKIAQSRRKKITQDDVCDIMRSLAIMSNSGVSLIDSLDTLTASAVNPAVSDLVRNIKNDVLAGKTLARAMQGQGNAFPEIASEMVAVADEGGQLGRALVTTTEYLETQGATKKAIVGALIYPALLMFMSIGTILGFMLFILPTFGKTFEGMKVKLPMITAAMLVAGTFVQEHVAAVVICSVITIVAATQAYKFKVVRDLLRRGVYRTPLVGTVARLFALSRSASTSGVVLSCGQRVASFRPSSACGTCHR